MARKNGDRRVGIDAGGTFTDIVTAEGLTAKVSSTRADPSRAVLSGLERIGVLTTPVDLVHGTTVATNAVLERKTSKIGMLVTKGFRDVLLIRRQERPDLYALQPQRPSIPIDPTMIAEVEERMGPHGDVIQPLDPVSLEHGITRLARKGAKALCVLFLHSYANDAHEQQAKRQCALMKMPCTVSSGLSCEFREVERGLAAMFNAALLGPVGNYLEHLAETLPEGSRLRVMSSDSGMLSPETAAKEPARLLMSGPAGGLVAARVYGAQVSNWPLLTLDMGGTSTDVALIPEDLTYTDQLTINGLPIRLPSVDLHTVGAGGGSIIRMDKGGALTVGPESQGADPGPAAYGKGDELTVTDANLLLGRIDSRNFASGSEALDLGAAERVARSRARQLSVSVELLLAAALRVTNVVMARALRVISLERGCDPRSGALLVFGGAGGLHGAALARLMGMRRVLVPPSQGVLSAQGLLWAPPMRSAARSLLLQGIPSRSARIRIAKELAAPLMSELLSGGSKRSELTVHVSCDLRYPGQSFELSVTDGGGSLESAFHEEHRRRFGFTNEDVTPELVAIRVRVEGARPDITMPKLAASRKSPAPVGWCRPIVGKSKLPMYERSALRGGQVIAGPAIIVESTGTTYLDADSRARVLPMGMLDVEVAS